MKESDIVKLREFHFYISALLAKKDKETSDHCRRVGVIYSHFSLFGWKCWGEYQSTIELIGEIHDGGKIVMPDSALKSRGRLHGLDLTLMENHPLLGAQMVPLCIPIVRNPILCHQEWYNGQGYPKGLKGEKIPEEARALSIIDAFDAMKGRRYQSPMSNSDIMKELRKKSGSQFDPYVFEQFKKFFRDYRKLFAQIY